MMTRDCVIRNRLGLHARAMSVGVDFDIGLERDAEIAAAIEEAIRLANDTPFGLAAYFFTRDIGRAFRVAGSVLSLAPNSRSNTNDFYVEGIGTRFELAGKIVEHDSND